LHCLSGGKSGKLKKGKIDTSNSHTQTHTVKDPRQKIYYTIIFLSSFLETKFGQLGLRALPVCLPALPGSRAKGFT